MDLSVVIPVYNEAGNISPLMDRLLPVLDGLGKNYEVLLVDDGSTDGTADELAKIANDHVRVLRLKRNFGQTAALMAGFDFAEGDVVIPMDGDLQNDPADIPKLLDKMAEGYEVVSGWRKNRKDTYLTRVLPSQIANGLISLVSGVRLKDYGCTLKAYHRDVLDGIRLYGEMHRFVPIYAKWQGARIAEVPVTHNPRTIGQSKYGMSRIIKVLLDLLVVKFLTQYEAKPIYVFGTVGVGFFGISAFAGVWALWLKLVEGVSFIQTPLPLLFTLGFITGVMCVLMGLLAEVLVRIYYESQGKPPYALKSNGDDS